jgi:hypothetical protein
VQPRESFFEFVFRSLNPRKINWGEEIDRRLGIFVQESVGNPYFRVCAFQAGLILFLLLLCWVWWDKMQQTKTVAAECLTDVINAKRLSDGRALEATDTYNRHMEMCNRVIEQQDSGISIGKGTADWQQKVDELQTQLAAERTQVARLEADRKQREELTAQMQTRIARLEERLRESGGNASAELVALVHRLEAELSSRAPAKK